MFVSFYDSIRFANWMHNGQGSGDTEIGAYTLGILDGAGVPINGDSITRNVGARWFLPSEDEWYKAAYHKNDGVTGNYWDYPTSTDAVPFSDQPPGSDAPDQSNAANFRKTDSIVNGYNDGFAVTGSNLLDASSQNYLTDVGAYTLSDSPYGTFDQCGNVFEWNEALITASIRGVRGGSWGSISGQLHASSRSFAGLSTNESGGIGFRVASIAIPEPSTLLLLCFGSLAMLCRRRSLVCASIVAAVVGSGFADRTEADTFGSGANTFNIEFVNIGNPNNAPDIIISPNPGGTVPYTYRMGKFEIPESAIEKANALGGLAITFGVRAPDKPATVITWNGAARFVNWLNTSTGSVPAYKFALQPGEVGYDPNANIELWTIGDAGYNPNNLYRNSLARYFLPSADEWYKAAYYDPSSGTYFDYPTGSDGAPTAVASGTAAGTAVFNQYFAEAAPADITLAGGLSPYGTMGQGGNVFEWEETELFDLVNDDSSSARGVRGGSYDEGPDGLLSSSRRPGDPTDELYNVGFRIASNAVPEPSTLLLVSTGVGVFALRRRRNATRDNINHTCFNPGAQLAVALALVAGTTFHTSTDAAEIRTVALSGQQAPGLPVGGVFDQFGTIQDLVLNDAGQVAFLGNSGTGVWSEGSGSLALVVIGGMQAPGLPDGVTFSSSQYRAQGLVLNDAGQTAFGHDGIWSEGSGTLSRVTSAGAHAPGTPSGVVFATNFSRPLLNNAGRTAFFAGLSGSGIDATNNQGIWSEGFGSLALVAREGDHAPGTPSEVNFRFQSGVLLRPVLNDAGQTAFPALLTGDGVDATNSEGIWSEGSGILALVARSGTPAPGTAGGVSFRNFNLGGPEQRLALNNFGQTAFEAVLVGSNVSNANDNGIWSEGSGALALVAREGDHAPGTPSGFIFRDNSTSSLGSGRAFD